MALGLEIPLLSLAFLVFAALLALYLKTRPPPPITPACDMANQSLVLPDGTRRSPYAASGLMERLDDEVRTTYDALQRSIVRFGNAPFLGTRKDDRSPFVFQTYSQVGERVADFASGLLQLGVRTGQKTFVGVYSQNRPEWVITEHAVTRQNMVLVPLYDTLGPDAVDFICNQAGVCAVVCDANKLPLLAKTLHNCKSVKLVVKMENVTGDDEKLFRGVAGVKLESFAEVERLGRSNRAPSQPPKPEDVCTVCYTSGTTGDPKGAMLTHRNMISDLAGVVVAVERSNLPRPFLTSRDVHLSYLPLAHMFERLVQLWVYSHGASIGFFRGDVKQLLSDVAELRPTIFPSVPRLLNRIYDKVLAKVEAKGGLAKKLFHMGLAAKQEEIKRRIIRRNSIWDLLVFRKIQAQLGGRVRAIVTGSAPIGDKTLTFLRAAFGVPVFEGYGQTECTAAATLTLPGDSSSGQVGPPLVCGEVKLFDVPDMNYFSRNNEGEVCFRGPHVMLGYLNNPEKTREAIDGDGWLHSGDIGRWLPNGTLKIIDRKKAIFKLSQGEYIAPEKIEQIYLRTPPLLNCFVYGSSLEAALVAVVVPDPETFTEWAAKEVPAAKGDYAALCKNPAVVQRVHANMEVTGLANGLRPFEQVKKIKLVTTAFSVENGLLTPTFKAKRPQLFDFFKRDIEELYAAIHADEAKQRHD